MIILNAYITLYKENIQGNSIMSGVRCEWKSTKSDSYHISQMETMDSLDILPDRKTLVKITILTGELCLKEMMEDSEFTLHRGAMQVGEGSINEIKEVYIEKRYLETLHNVEKIKNIISCAENLSNSIIYEDVYELIK